MFHNIKLYVQLGRAGDIMSILPLLWRDAQTGQKSRLMVASEFAGLLDGISYVDPVIYDGPHYELDKAVNLARQKSKEVVVTQFNGPREVIDAVTRSQKPGQATSFEKDMWRVTGRLKEWDDCLPLTFDRRDAGREQELVRSVKLHLKGKWPSKPLLLLALKSNSSPFPYAELLWNLVTLKFGKTWRILELPQAERIYDLLALYEKATLLIAVDSAPLHLAWACRKLPVFALTQDRPMLWHGSSWRPNHWWHCRYHDFPERAVEMMTAVESVRKKKPEGNFVTVFNVGNNGHLYELAPQYLPVYEGMCGRDSAAMLQDGGRSPYVRDVLRMAMQRAPSDDTEIILTRPHVSLPASSFSGPSWAYRMRRTADGPQFEPIADLFAAPKRWWKEALMDMPDLVLNQDHFWSECLRVLFQKQGATDATGVCSFVKG